MSKLLNAHVTDHPDKIALVDDDGSRTWSELDERVDRFIQALRESGLVVGDRVALLSQNRREFFEVTLACLHGGFILVPMNWHCVPSELAYILDNSAAAAMIVDEGFTDTAAIALSLLPKHPKVHLTMGAGGSFEQAISEAERSDTSTQVAGSVMFYTSGTTGRPKGVKGWFSEVGAPPESIAAMADGFIALLGIDASATTLLNGPAYHTAQFFWSLFPIVRGGTVIMRRRFDSAETLRLIEEHAIANVHLVPTQFTRLLRLPDATRTEFCGDSLRTILHGSAPCPPHIKRSMIEWWGPIITEYYGATEGGVTHLITSDEWLERPGSVGRTLPIFETIVTDDAGNRQTSGETGTLWFRHLGGRDFEYYGEASKTDEAHLEPGVFTFGDIGRVDESGYLYLSDRKVDLIISGGVNIYPAEIEGVLVDHPAVADAAVFGIPDDEYGEQVKGAVELLPGYEPSAELAEELRKKCSEQLASYKVPRSIDFEAELPRQASGKLYKRQLRDRYWAESRRSI